MNQTCPRLTATGTCGARIVRTEPEPEWFPRIGDFPYPREETLWNHCEQGHAWMVQAKPMKNKPALPIPPILAALAIATIAGAFDLLRRANDWVKSG
jgi:hypothetical protein